MMKVQARMLVPAWKRLRAAQAFISVSCTRSSATSRLPDSDRPKARKCGITSASRSEEHTSELQSLMRISYAVFCLKKKKKRTNSQTTNIIHTTTTTKYSTTTKHTAT